MRLSGELSRASYIHILYTDGKQLEEILTLTNTTYSHLVANKVSESLCIVSDTYNTQVKSCLRARVIHLEVKHGELCQLVISTNTYHTFEGLEEIIFAMCKTF